MFDKIYAAQINHHKTVTENTVLEICGHGINIENLGNTTVRISGLNPILAGEFRIIDSYGDARIYRHELYVISFDQPAAQSAGPELITPINKVVFHVDRIKGFPYPV